MVEKTDDVSGVFARVSEGKVHHPCLDLIVKSSVNAIIGKTLDGVIVSWNEGAQRIYGYLPEEVIGKHISLLVPFELKDELPVILERIKRGEHVEHYDTVRLRKDKSRICVSLTISPIKDENGSIVGASTISRNISEGIKIIKSLEESEENYRQLIENAPIGISVVAGGRIVLVNPKELELFGLKQETDMVGHSISEFMSKENIRHVFEMSNQESLSKTSSKPISFEVERPGGVKAYVEAQFFASKYKGKDCLVAFHSDATERMLAKTEIHIAANLFDAATDSIFVHDLDGNFVYFNEAAYKLRGFSKDEFARMNVHALNAPDSAKLFDAHITGLLEKGEATFELTNMRKDKSLMPVEVRARVVESDGRKLIISVARDITERKKAEEQLNKTSEELRYESEKLMVLNEKLNVVGKLTRHDIRNKLAVVKGNVFLAKKKVGDSPDVTKYLGEIESAIDLVDRILGFSHIYEQVGVEELVSTDVGKCFDEAVSLFSGLHNVKVVNECHGLNVLADSLLRQIFYNLIDNSLKYGKKLTRIRAYFETVDNTLRLIYEDDGGGISKEEKGKIFAEGYGHGTGYGLFLMKKICEGYGWTIQEEGNPGEGARFTMIVTK